MHRRDFLRPRQVATAAGQVVGAADAVREVVAELAEAPPGPSFSVLRFSRRAMATTFEVLLPFGTPDSLEIAEAALDEVDRLESQLTVYRDTSEVSRLNCTAAHAPIPVEEGLFHLLTLSADLTAATGGAFDVASGALVKAWGFWKGPPRVPTDEERERARERSGMQHVVLDPERRTVHFRRPGVEINLGSIGKGYALDRAAERLRRRGDVARALLHGGQSSVCAIGSEPGSERGWTVGLVHPWRTAEHFGVVRLRDQALGTSSATFRHLEYNGRRLGHTLDPRTGWPAEGVASASVVAPTAAEADALATAFTVLGAEKAREYCASRPDVGVVLLLDGADAPVVLGLARKLVEVV